MKCVLEFGTPSLVFVLPILLLSSALATDLFALFAIAFAVQYVGLIAERWFFFAQANHPQNLYYQTWKSNLVDTKTSNKLNYNYTESSIGKAQQINK